MVGLIVVGHLLLLVPVTQWVEERCDWVIVIVVAVVYRLLLFVWNLHGQPYWYCRDC